MTAGSAIPGIALESDARVATSIISTDTLAILTFHSSGQPRSKDLVDCMGSEGRGQIHR